jgi:hypothetical protein
VNESLVLIGATIVLAVATIVLAAMTCWYAVDTHRIVRRMDIEREERIRPILTFQLVPWGPGLIKLRIQNVGSGPAKDVAGKVESILVSSGSESINWSYPLLTTDKYEEFHIPLPADMEHAEGFMLAEVRSKVSQVKAIFTYKSISGVPHKLEDSIDIQKVTQDWLDSKMLMTRDRPERLLPRIAKALEDLASKA